MNNNNQQQANDYMEIDLLELAAALWKRKWLILIVAVLFAAIALSYAYFMVTPMYTSSALLYVNNNSISFGSANLSISSSDLTAASKLVSTYIVILSSRMTLEDVIDTAHLPYTYEQLNKMVSATQVNSTEVFRITVKCDDPYMAEKIANTIVKVLPQKIADVVEGSNVKVVDYAVVDTRKVSPSLTKYTAVGLLLGFVLACAYVFIEMMMDDIVHDEATLIDTYGLPVLASIPDLRIRNVDNYGYYDKNGNRTSKSTTSKTKKTTTSSRRTTKAKEEA
ncbi:MAG: hypothetical protein IKD81_02780 [Eubacteriaceae bacterium]|nr:hypothetical protein [Eubacteriaceae bacterium]